MQTQKIIDHFNQTALQLSKLNQLSEQLAKRVMSRLDYIKLQPQIIVDCGSGMGSDYNLLGSKFPQAQIIQLDIALVLLKQNLLPTNFLTQRFKRQPLLVCADVNSIPFAVNSIDFYYANLLLPWLNNPSDFIKEMQRSLKIGGAFCIAGLGVDSFKELKQLGIYVNKFPDMHDIGDMLLSHGFDDPVVDCEIINLEYVRFSDLVSDIKIINGKAFSGINNFKSSAKIMSLRKIWHQRYTITLELFVAHGWKAKQLNNLPEGYSTLNFQARKK